MRALIYRSTSAHISGGHDRADRRNPLNVHNDVGTQTEDVNKAVFDKKEGKKYPEEICQYKTYKVKKKNNKI